MDGEQGWGREEHRGRSNWLRDQAPASLEAQPPLLRPLNPEWRWLDAGGTAGPRCRRAQSLQLPAESRGRGSGVQSSACFCKCFDDAFACSHHYRDTALSSWPQSISSSSFWAAEPRRSFLPKLRASWVTASPPRGPHGWGAMPPPPHLHLHRQLASLSLLSRGLPLNKKILKSSGQQFLIGRSKPFLADLLKKRSLLNFWC